MSLKLSSPIINLCFSLLLTGCASTGGNYYAPSEADNAASISGLWIRHGLFTWEGYGLTAVDGKYIDQGLFNDPFKSTTKLEPGVRKIRVSMRFNRGEFGGVYQTAVPMEVDLKPATEYQIKGTITGDEVTAWLEVAATQEVASKKYLAAPISKTPPPAAPSCFWRDPYLPAGSWTRCSY